MLMPGRKYEAASGYRYGFNGKENDNDVKGEGNQQDYGMRVYDSRIGKFLSIDPLTKKYPQLTPYQFASNSPVMGIDLDGLEQYYAADGNLLGKVGKSTEIRIIDTKGVKNATDLINKLNKTNNSKQREAFNTILRAGSKESYNSKDDAAADFVLRNGSMSICTNTEYSARIGGVRLRNSKTSVFVLGTKVTGDEQSADINSSYLWGATPAGGVHTHGADPQMPGIHADNFSGKNAPGEFFSGDMDWSNRNKIPIYLGNPAGQLKVYNPKDNYELGDENGVVVRDDMPFDIRDRYHGRYNPRPAFNYQKISYEEQRDPTAADAIPYKLDKNKKN
jgi:RHS repeat-associated protein